MIKADAESGGRGMRGMFNRMKYYNSDMVQRTAAQQGEVCESQAQQLLSPGGLGGVAGGVLSGVYGSLISSRWCSHCGR